MLKISPKKKWSIAASVTACLGVFLLSQPYFTSKRIRSAYIDGDVAALSEYIDFPALRSNLKERTNANYAEPAKRDQAGSMYNLGYAVILSQIESSLQPDGLHALVNRRKASGVDRTIEERQETFRHTARHAYQSPNHFTTTMTFRDEFDVQLMLHRVGVDWKLCDLAFASK